MGWDKLKSMFVVNDGAGSGAVKSEAELEDYHLPADDVGTLPSTTDTTTLTGSIPFQDLYDQAGIPNTDEVEALERFLGGLDASLPQASKLAAAKAFLNAIGKAPNDVLEDAARKIRVVRAVADAKRADTESASAKRQQSINDLQRQIDQHRAAVEGLQKDLESVRSQCTIEEARLQGARAFFGVMGDVKPPASAQR